MNSFRCEPGCGGCFLELLKCLFVCPVCFLVNRFRWLFGFDITPRPAERYATQGIVEAVTLQGLIVATLVSLLAFVKEDAQGALDFSTRYELAIGYIVLSLIPILGMVIMIRSRLPDGAHSLDPHAVRFLRCALASAIVVVTGSGFAAWSGRLPWQTPSLKITVTSAEVKTYQEAHPDLGIAKGDRMVVAYAPFCPSSSAITEIRDPLVMEIELADNIARSWQIASVEGDALVPGNGRIPRDPTRVGNDLPGSKGTFHWPKLSQSESYMLNIKLHPIANDIFAERLRELIAEDPAKVLSIKIYYRK